MRRTKEFKEEPLVLGSRHKGRGRLGGKFLFLVDLYGACQDQKQNKIVMESMIIIISREIGHVQKALCSAILSF